VSPSFRTAINIPQNIWPQFRDKLRAVGASLLETGCKEDLQAAADAVHEDDDLSSPTKPSTDTAAGASSSEAASGTVASSDP